MQVRNSLAISSCSQEESQNTKPSLIFVPDSQIIQYTLAIERSPSLYHFHIVLKGCVAVASARAEFVAWTLYRVRLENFHFSSKLHSPNRSATSKPLSGSLAMVGDSEPLELTSYVQVALSETRKLLFSSACDEILIKDWALLNISCHPILVPSVRKQNKLEKIASRAWCCMPVIPAFRSRLGSL